MTLAGFLPTLEKHIRINPNITTMLRVELESMFASLDQLRRQPSNTAVEGDDWKWVLRSASATRPVLEWMDETQIAAQNMSSDRGRPRLPRMRLEFTDGARHPGSGSNLVSAPATAFAYDQRLGGTSRLILAGQMSYDQRRAGRKYCDGVAAHGITGRGTAYGAGVAASETGAGWADIPGRAHRSGRSDGAG